MSRAREPGRERPGEPAAQRGIRGFLARLGPGLITGGADDDPSGIATYSQAGARYRYGLLWTVLLQIPLMSAAQLMSARIGLVTGENLTEVIRHRLPRSVLWGTVALLVFANLLTAAADVAGVAAGFELLFRLPHLLLVPLVALGLLALLVYAHYPLIRRIFKWLTLALFAYVVAGVMAKPDWGEVLLRTFVPEIHPTRDYLGLLVAIFGTTISPYLFLWQSVEEVEDMEMDGMPHGEPHRSASPAQLRDARTDTIVGMIFSQVIDYFIIIAAGATLFAAGERNIETARQAALALHPIGRGLGTILFALGMIGTGLLAIPTLVGGAAYALSSLAGKRAWMSARLGEARFFYGTLAAGMALSAVLAVSGISPVTLLIGAAVVNGLLAPPLLAIMLWITNDARIMGEHTNGWSLNLLGGLTFLFMGASSIALLVWWVVGLLGG